VQLLQLVAPDTLNVPTGQMAAGGVGDVEPAKQA
jgi:hypothetical protein